jgi:hypothetical protein
MEEEEEEEEHIRRRIVVIGRGSISRKGGCDRNRNIKAELTLTEIVGDGAQPQQQQQWTPQVKMKIFLN